jgi:hypothetical protein
MQHSIWIADGTHQTFSSHHRCLSNFPTVTQTPVSRRGRNLGKVCVDRRRQLASFQRLLQNFACLVLLKQSKDVKITEYEVGEGGSKPVSRNSINSHKSLWHYPTFCE